jgi:hypothetical protein
MRALVVEPTISQRPTSCIKSVDAPAVTRELRPEVAPKHQTWVAARAAQANVER